VDVDRLALARQATEFLEHPLSTFRPWQTPVGRSPQREFYRAAGTHKKRVFRAGNQVGKTTAVAFDVAMRLKGWHQFARRGAPVKGWWSCLDWEFGVGQIAWPALKRWLAPGDVTGIAYLRKHPVEVPTSVHFKNGSVLEFKSAEMGRSKYQSATLDFVAVDEEHPADIIEEIKLRLVVRDGDFFASLTPLNREPWVREMEREPDCCTVRASMIEAAEAGLLPMASVRALEETLPDRQRRVRIYGEHAALEGLVYPEFTEQTHVLVPRGVGLFTRAGERRYPWPLPDAWAIYAGIDFGYSVPTAIVLGHVDPGDGTAIVPLVPYAAGIRASRWAELIPELIPHPRLAASMLADPSAADERAELAAKGIDTHAAENAVLSGIETVERFMTLNGRPRPKLYVVQHEVDAPRHPAVGRMDGRALVREIFGYQYPSQDGSGAAKKDLPVKKDDHACDALRYMLVHVEEAFGGPPSFRLGVSEDEIQGRRSVFA
jgi:phage terminase large subunit-like protein